MYFASIELFNDGLISCNGILMYAIRYVFAIERRRKIRLLLILEVSLWIFLNPFRY